MVQEIKRFLTEDGKEFPSLDLAVEHENIVELLEGLKYEIARDIESENTIAIDDNLIESFNRFLVKYREGMFKYYNIDEAGKGVVEIKLLQNGQLLLGDLLASCDCVLKKVTSGTLYQLVESMTQENNRNMVALYLGNSHVKTYLYGTILPCKKRKMFNNQNRTIIELDGEEYMVFQNKSISITEVDN